jgi:hypothetical protein
MRTRDAADPNCIAAPAPSDELLHKNFETVAKRFREAGFTNVETVGTTTSDAPQKYIPGLHKHHVTTQQPVARPKDWIRHTVYRIEFGCLTEFTCEDYCRRDEKIVIHYHEDGLDPQTVAIAPPPSGDDGAAEDAEE